MRFLPVLILLSLTHSAVAAPPTAPEGFQTTSVRSTNVDFSWEASEGSVGYRVYKNTRPFVTVIGTQVADVEVVEGAVYGYTLSAYNNDGESKRIGPLIVRIPDGTPPKISALFPRDKSVVRPETRHLSFVTDENARCSFSRGDNAFLTTGTKVHVASLVLRGGVSETFTLLCSDQSGNVEKRNVTVTTSTGDMTHSISKRIQLQAQIDILSQQVYELTKAIEAHLGQ
jgi:hypothetical protein